MKRTTFILTVGMALPLLLSGCSKTTGGHASSGTIIHSTITSPYTTSDTDVTGVTIPITTYTDLDIREIEAGTFQDGNLVYIEGTVVDTSNVPMEGVLIKAYTDSGERTGQVRYRNSSGAIDPPGTSATAVDGKFMIFNAAPGRLLLLSIGGGNGNQYITANANEIVRVTIPLTLEPLQAFPHTGKTYHGPVTPGTAPTPSDEIPDITITNLGQGVPFPTTSISGGDFSFLTSVAGETATYYKLSEDGFFDTYTLFETEIGNGNLEIFDSTKVEQPYFKPGAVTIDPTKGIVTGIIWDNDGLNEITGATAEIHNQSGTDDAYFNGTIAVTGTSTDATGWFAIFNVPPGTQLLVGKATDLQKGIPIEVFANSITIVPTKLKLTTANAETISFSGITRNLQGVPQGNVTVTVIGGETTPSNAGGNFSFDLPANSDLIFTTSVE